MTKQTACTQCLVNDFSNILRIENVRRILGLNREKRESWAVGIARQNILHGNGGCNLNRSRLGEG
ncbi:MAG: hypothetical protein LBF49_03535 [Puniceicoccales bacterium]|nr:hypothetical protein [Puniceicoccales bacterium]